MHSPMNVKNCVHCEYDFALIAFVIVYIFALGPPY